MSTLTIIILIVVGVILLSIFLPDYWGNQGWVVKHREKCPWMSYSVYYEGDFVDRFETLDEAKQFIKEQKSPNNDDDWDDEGKIVYREL